MNLWQQNYDPAGNIWLSSLIASLPILFFFFALIKLKLKGFQAKGVNAHIVANVDNQVTVNRNRRRFRLFRLQVIVKHHHIAGDAYCAFRQIVHHDARSRDIHATIEAKVRHGLQSILRETDADEIMVNGQIFDHQARLHSFELAMDVKEELLG